MRALLLLHKAPYVLDGPPLWVGRLAAVRDESLAVFELPGPAPRDVCVDVLVDQAMGMGFGKMDPLPRDPDTFVLEYLP